MKNKKIGTSILAFLLAAATAAAGAQPVLAADLGTVTDNVPAIVAASASVSVIDASGDLEAAYAEWGAVSNATGYNVYIKPAGGSYTQLDTMLVMLGLTARPAVIDSISPMALSVMAAAR